MKIHRTPDGKYLRVLPEDTKFDSNMLLGWHQKKNDPWIVAEDNLVNRIVLGLDALPDRDEVVELHYTEGLKDFQVADLRKMMHLDHFLNMNPMGYGKTIETVRFLQEKRVKNALIVCPKIILSQWQEKLWEWGGLESTIYEGKKTVPDEEGIWLVNYDKLRNEKTRLQFRRFQWQYLILDEAHKIKNRDSAQTKAVKELPARHRLAITGTPILRYVDDLWSTLHFLDPRYSGLSYWSFRSYFCELNEDEWGTKIVGLTKNSAKVAVLNKLLSLMSIRNEKSVTNGKFRETVRLPMSKKQRELYRKEKQLLLDELPEDLTIPNGAVLALRLMQTTSWPGMYIPGEAGPKFEWVLETCRSNPNEKFVVFSVFEKTVAALVEYLNSNGVSAVSITGKNSEQQNASAKQMFISTDVQVIIGTIKAMGQGYDGLQKVSRLMVCLDRDWSPEIMSQVEDRLNRMGQDSIVSIYYLECQASFDQHVGRVNMTKAKDIREALQNE